MEGCKGVEFFVVFFYGSRRIALDVVDSKMLSQNFLDGIFIFAIFFSLCMPGKFENSEFPYSMWLFPPENAVCCVCKCPLDFK